MKYGDIVLILFFVLLLYYAGMVAMDMYKMKMTKESEKEKEKETEIDISDEVENFKTIHVSRETADRRPLTKPDESKTSKEKEETITNKPEGEKQKEAPRSKTADSKQSTEPAQAEAAEDFPDTDSEAHEHIKEEVSKKDPQRNPHYKMPTMLGGITVDEIVNDAKRRCNGDESALGGIIHICEAA